MNWAKQSEEMLKNWTDSQQQMWDNWTKMMAPMGAQAPMNDLWKQSVAVWEKAIKESNGTQAAWMKMWFDSLETMPNVPEEFVKWAEQAVAMSHQWAESQEQLWDGWFAVVKSMDAAALTGTWEEESKKAMDAWQDSASKMVEANKKFAETWAMFNTTANGK